ncbi:MAG: hypothetical protein A2806_00885 [Candidatus Terrybacteria bacterium RIFCSPHIGHO2_01_FULL_48_17]|uniref:Uncharacterized protein n=1 Tax=Candidatus Terrybacteria bacterium RIFCSPHIGHO2_01_FULL_48_17 TaxID=1802362 RepID=A0A1G2PIR4_9BACT|nr:MAG: hypothetical protein A2806_00885 [Candidatus Terrybacteria bacterium RIFCSPHIGHO2_01_FULL_48_17]OHA52923.1 MAG: hypothetical protein A3A30_01465 [Candidatus Terrybacteria bacterium RIFCSPLOWO2_01_FULL_48_14]
MLVKNNRKVCFPCLLTAILLVGFALGAGLWLLRRSPGGTESTPTINEQVAAYAKELFSQKQTTGTDFSQGPCLDNAERFSDWIIDIAHSPRQAVDDDPQNQCSAFREGRARHFVELDLGGNVIRVY